MNETATKVEDSWAQKERRALFIGKWGNFFMGLAGVLAAWVSHSQALLVDGLFSLVGFTAAVFAARVNASIRNLPDERRPLGYAANESIYTTFRALSLMALVAFAFGAAILNIIDYASGGELPELRYGTIVIYFAVICVVCFGIAANHHFAWKSTGKQSDLLRLEAQAAFFDGILTLAAGLGLSLLPLLKNGPLYWVTPIGDSIVVLLLCAFVVGRYYLEFMKGLSELAGVSVADTELSSARNTVQAIVNDIGGQLIDFSAIRLGRLFQAQLYFDPLEPIDSKTVDKLTRTCDIELSKILGETTTVVLISRHGRVLPVSDASIQTPDQTI
ncbi:MAG: cation transporter [Paracoccaceae bacterium]